MNKTGHGRAAGLSILGRVFAAVILISASAAQVMAQSNWVNSGADVYTNGRVAIGTSAPSGMLRVFSSVNSFTDMTIENPNAGASASSRFRMGENPATGKAFFLQYFNSFYAPSGLITPNRAFFGASSGVTNGLVISTLAGAPIIFATGGAAAGNERMQIDGVGNVGIGIAPSASYKLRVSGDAHFTGTVSGGNIIAAYQDIAEWVPSTTELQPGDVVVLNTRKHNEVMASVDAYDTRVAGVVSAQPGLSLGVAADSKELIATYGRVKVRVDASRAPIQVGDLLVTSDIPGVAMRSEPVDIGGRKFHQPGTILGKALEPLESGQGTILVLLSLQ